MERDNWENKAQFLVSLKNNSLSKSYTVGVGYDGTEDYGTIVP